MNQQELRELRILVIESSAAVRDQLRQVFAETEGCIVIGEASDGDSGIEA